MSHPSTFMYLTLKACTRLSSTIGLMALSIPAAWPANPYQTTESILAVARQYIVDQNRSRQGKLDVAMSRLDARLRLPRCREDLRVQRPPRSRSLGKVSLRVICHKNDRKKPWSIFVSARVSLLIPVYIASNYIARGNKIRATDITLDERDAALMRQGYFSHRKQILGTVSKRSINPGQVLSPTMVQPPFVVRRGQTVSIIARQGELVVHMKGRALADGPLGARIRVKNTTSKRIIEGEITRPGEISITL